MIILFFDKINIIYLMKAIYYRPIYNIEPILDLSIKELVCVDTLPRAEFDMNIYDSNFYNKNFIGILLNKCIKLDFCLEKIINIQNDFKEKYANSSLLIFKNKELNKTIKYYISTNIDYNMSLLLEDDIKSSKCLIVKTTIPDEEFYTYFINKKILLSFSKIITQIIKKNKNYNKYFIDNVDL